MMTEQGDPILEKAKQLRAAGATVEQVKQYLQSKGYEVGGPPSVPRESLRLNIPKETTAAPAESTRGLSRSRPGASGDFQSLAAPGQGRVLMDDVLPTLATHALSAAQGVPGMERLEAFAGSAGSQLTDHPMSYGESLKTLRGETEKIPSELRTVERLVGAAPLAASKPLSVLSGAKGGALFGAADQALSADDMSAGERAVRTVAGGVVGGTLGKAVEMGVTGLRTAAAPGSATNLFAREADRAASAKRLYDAANREGHAQAASQAVQGYLAEPEIAELVGKLQQLDEFKQLAPDAPEMLDAIYKTLSDNAKTVGKALEVANPSKLNTGRFRQRDIKATQQRQLGAMDQTMPSYREAVNDYATRTAEMKALTRGQDAIKERLSTAITSGKNLNRTTPEAFANSLRRGTSGEADAAMQGILGGTREAFDRGTMKGVRALSKAPELMRNSPSADQALFDLITRLSLTSGAAAR